MVIAPSVFEVKGPAFERVVCPGTENSTATGGSSVGTAGLLDGLLLGEVVGGLVVGEL